jgi:hypothetical protein
MSASSFDRDATSFLGLNLTHNTDGTVTITQPKLLLKLFSLYPPRKDAASAPNHPYPPLPKETDPPPQPADHFTHLRLLDILLYPTKSRPDIWLLYRSPERKAVNKPIGTSATSTTS